MASHCLWHRWYGELFSLNVISGGIEISWTFHEYIFPGKAGPHRLSLDSILGRTMSLVSTCGQAKVISSSYMKMSLITLAFSSIQKLNMARLLSYLSLGAEHLAALIGVWTSGSSTSPRVLHSHSSSTSPSHYLYAVVLLCGAVEVCWWGELGDRGTEERRRRPTGLCLLSNYASPCELWLRKMAQGVA